MIFEDAGSANGKDMDRLQNIVVGIDYSPCSRNALKEAVRIARWNETALHVVHVIYDEAIAELKRATGVDEEDIVTARGLRLENFVIDIVGEEETLEIHSEVIIGHPFHEVMRVVEDKNADLLVLGAQGHSHEKSTATGVLATRCVRKSPSKVLLVRRAQDHKFHNIVAAVDYSPTSRLALHEAARMVRQDGGQLHIVNVHSPPWKHFMEEEMAHDLVVPEDRARAYLEEVEKELADFVYDCLDEFEGLSGVRTESVEAVSLGWGITDYLGKVKADLVVLGTRGRSPVKTLIMGSIAEHVVRESSCSVLTVKPAGFVYHAPVEHEH